MTKKSARLVQEKCLRQTNNNLNVLLHKVENKKTSEKRLQSIYTNGNNKITWHAVCRK